MLLSDIFSNTLAAVKESEQKGETGPFAYHNWVRTGFVRFNGVENQGSFIKELQTFEDTWSFLCAQDWVDMTREEVEKECDWNEHTIYYRSIVSDELTAYHGGRPLKDIPEDRVKLVRVSKERHGLSLYMEATPMDFVITKECRLIVSKKTHPHNMTGKDVIATWFPGTLANPNNATGLEDAFVKFIWGV